MKLKQTDSKIISSKDQKLLTEKPNWMASKMISNTPTTVKLYEKLIRSGLHYTIKVVYQSRV